MPGFTRTELINLIGRAIGARAYTPPANLHIGLSTTAIADNGTGITEPVGNGYARVAVANNTTNWGVPTLNGIEIEVLNLTTVNFPTPTGNWGVVTHWFASDAATGGTIRLTGTLTGTSESRTIGANNPTSFEPGALRAFFRPIA